jgi:PLD-like domain
MAKVIAIFQPVPGAVTHQKFVNDLFVNSDITAVCLSSAFVNSGGVSALQASLSSYAAVTKCFVGIRNGVTTVQGLKILLDTGAQVYVVDTGTPYRIFHPKFYAVISKTKAYVIIGSANTTYSGLHSNIEVSAHFSLELSDKSDSAFLSGLLDPIQFLIKTYPLNCYRLKDKTHANNLFTAGLVEDEDNPKTTGPVGIASKGTNTVPVMPLPKGIPSKAKSSTKPAPPPTTTRPAPIGSVTYGRLVWEKPKLPPSDLQFPGATGNATGVLRLTQAKYTVGGVIIDQTTYFRNTVFGALAWTSTTSGKETAVLNTALVIAGVLVGIYDLPVSHNSAWESGQGNYTTAIHWDVATPKINDTALIGRALRLYAPSGANRPFVIEID